MNMQTKYNKVKTLVRKWHERGQLLYVRFNQKTLLSLDLGTICPKEVNGNPCRYCYKHQLHALYKQFKPNILYCAPIFNSGYMAIFLEEFRKIVEDNFSFRAFAISDIMPQHIRFWRKVFTFIRSRGFRVHAITKQYKIIKRIEDCVDIIQLSVDKHGNHVHNATMASMTARNPSKYKIRCAALNEDELWYFLPKVDIVTLYHGPKKYLNVPTFKYTMGKYYNKFAKQVEGEYAKEHCVTVCCTTGHCLDCQKCWK